MREAMSLLEMIFVLLISSILSVATFKSLNVLYSYSARHKALAQLSLEAQITLNQLESMLYYRVPGTLIGYTPGGECESISEMTQKRPVLEWIGLMQEANIRRAYDGFADIMSTKPKLKVYNLDSSYDFNSSVLIFAGSLERGLQNAKACEGAYGWHGNESTQIFDFNVTGDNEIVFDSSKTPRKIYEKYYLAKSAFAVTRAQNVDMNAECIGRDLPKEEIDDDTLLLFYNFRPWRGETYCADTSGRKEGNVSMLSKDVKGFRVVYDNDVLKIGLDMNRSVGGRSVHIGKQKVVF